MNLKKPSFLALAAIGWVDGALQKVEAQSLLRAAKEAGLGESDLADVEKATKEKTELASISFDEMSEWDKVLTYALGAWIAQVDGVVSTSEHTTLNQIGEKLGLPDATRKRAAVAAYDIACLPEGKPDKYDFSKLEARLKDRMPQLKTP